MSGIKAKIEQMAADGQFIGLWEIVKSVEGIEKPKGMQPYLWPWSRLRPLMQTVGQNISLEDADRRVIIMSNPGAQKRHHSTTTLYLSCSIYNGGEKAPVHRHTSNASRFVLEGSGGYTTIEGEKCIMSRGDLIVTPAGTWHDHGNDGTEPVIWVDVLDLPLVENLDVNFFEFDHYETKPDGKKVLSEFQTITLPTDHSTNLYSTGGLRPSFVDHTRGESIGTPMFVYRWEHALEALNSMRNLKGSPSDGIILEYINPTNGESVTRTMNFSVQLLRPGEQTLAHQHTSSSSYCCLQGHGRSIVSGQIFEWGPNDLFVIPNSAVHSHENLSKNEDAVLYSVSDSPIMRHLGLYKEKAVT